MELENDELRIEREKSELDREVIRFTSILDLVGIDYVLISGYVAILTGRSRGTEDIDILIRPREDQKEKLIKKLEAEDYWCINEELEQVFSLMEDGISPRVARKGEVIPNFELSLPEDRFDRKAIEDSITAKINSDELKISPLELQIIYKLYLGSEKDWEDALHLYTLFSDSLIQEKLENLASKMNVEEELDELGEA